MRWMASLLRGSSFHRPEQPLRVLGIDLGTTNSTVAEIVWMPSEPEPGPVRCLSIEQPTTAGRYIHVLVPSVVAIREDDKVWVGEGAKRLRSLPEAGTEEYRSWFAETKNDMGIRRTYHRAPAGFRSARAIARHILRFLYEAALAESDIPPARVVVTVPASFQVAQRQDTLDAAQGASIQLSGGELLDEPVAAFLAYLNKHSEQVEDLLPANSGTKTLLVFDFGGGTCDVAIFRLGRDGQDRLTVAPLSVSRYHRLGGGDIDRAIIHEVLLPQLLEQNGLSPHDLEYEEKRHRVQPALLGIAESLKQKLSIEVARLRALGRLGAVDKDSLVQKHPGRCVIRVRDRELHLQSPALSLAQFESVLAPFLERDLLLPREDDYRITCSIFAPIEDALSRGGLDPEAIDLCLLVGGSALIPQVQDAVTEFFPNARVLSFEDREDAQTAVAQGAALHALSLALTGRGVLQPICHDDIYLETRQGALRLITAGAALPFPPGESYQSTDELLAPEQIPAGQQGAIRVRLTAGAERRELFENTWELRGPIRKGERLVLEYRLDENQVLRLRLYRQAAPEAGEFRGHVENPLTHVVNPSETRRRIQELEEQLRTQELAREQQQRSFEELGDLYRELGQHEKALAFYRQALARAESPAAFLLNRMAFCARDLGDRERTEKFFREAARVESWSGTFFNWALARMKWADTAGALELVERAIALEDEPPYRVLQAQLLRRLGRWEQAERILKEALPRFGPPQMLDEFELAWLAEGARMAGDAALHERIQQLLRRRPRASGGFAPGVLPDLAHPPRE